MGGVAGNAAARFDHRMFKGKGAGGVGVAFSADGVLVVGRAELLVLKRAVWIVAIGAAHEPFIHLVMKCLGKGGAHIFVAFEAKRRLLRDEQGCLGRRVMDAMATETTDSCFGMFGLLKVGVFAGVAGEAGFVNLCCGELA